MKSIRSTQSLSVIKSLIAAAAITSTASSTLASETEDARGITDLDPRGVYFNRFTGGFPGTEWFTTLPIAGSTNYRLADIVGGGWNAIVTPEGAVDILNAPGDGQYSDEDNYILNPSFAGSTFVFNNNRAPYTDVDFPLQLESPVDGNSMLTGTYNTTKRTVNPETGEILTETTELSEVLIVDDIFSITDPANRFYRGVFETPTRIAYRVVVPTPSDTRFRTFPGSALTIRQNLMGLTRMTSINSFEATYLFQTRTGLGNQQQSIITHTSVRVDPYPAGDLNGDREVDAADQLLFADQLGLDESQDTFNIAADLDGNYVIDAQDQDLFNQLFCPADFTGDNQLNFFDISAFLSAFTDADPAADFNADGQFNFFDISAYLTAFGAGCP